MSFNSQPPEDGWPYLPTSGLNCLRFQLTAARRRLDPRPPPPPMTATGFNSQPPEDGWVVDRFS